MSITFVIEKKSLSALLKACEKLSISATVLTEKSTKKSVCIELTFPLHSSSLYAAYLLGRISARFEMEDFMIFDINLHNGKGGVL